MLALGTKEAHDVHQLAPTTSILSVGVQQQDRVVHEVQCVNWYVLWSHTPLHLETVTVVPVNVFEGLLEAEPEQIQCPEYDESQAFLCFLFPAPGKQLALTPATQDV